MRNVIEDLCNGSTPDSDSVCGGSNPSSSAIGNTQYLSKMLGIFLVFRPFSAKKVSVLRASKSVFPLVFPYRRFYFPLFVYRLDKLFHSGSAFLFHFLSYMTVNIQRKSGSCMTKISLYGLNIIPGTNGGNCVRMP